MNYSKESRLGIFTDNFKQIYGNILHISLVFSFVTLNLWLCT